MLTSSWSLSLSSSWLFVARTSCEPRGDRPEGEGETTITEFDCGAGGGGGSISGGGGDCDGDGGDKGGNEGDGGGNKDDGGGDEVDGGDEEDEGDGEGDTDGADDGDGGGGNVGNADDGNTAGSNSTFVAVEVDIAVIAAVVDGSTMDPLPRGCADNAGICDVTAGSRTATLARTSRNNAPHTASRSPVGVRHKLKPCPPPMPFTSITLCLRTANPSFSDTLLALSRRREYAAPWQLSLEPPQRARARRPELFGLSNCSQFAAALTTEANTLVFVLEISNRPRAPCTKERDIVSPL